MLLVLVTLDFTQVTLLSPQSTNCLMLQIKLAAVSILSSVYLIFRFTLLTRVATARLITKKNKVGMTVCVFRHQVMENTMCVVKGHTCSTGTQRGQMCWIPWIWSYR